MQAEYSAVEAENQAIEQRNAQRQAAGVTGKENFETMGQLPYVPEEGSLTTAARDFTEGALAPATAAGVASYAGSLAPAAPAAASGGMLALAKSILSKGWRLTPAAASATLGFNAFRGASQLARAALPLSEEDKSIVQNKMMQTDMRQGTGRSALGVVGDTLGGDPLAAASTIAARAPRLAHVLNRAWDLQVPGIFMGLYDIAMRDRSVWDPEVGRAVQEMQRNGKSVITQYETDEKGNFVQDTPGDKNDPATWKVQSRIPVDLDKIRKRVHQASAAAPSLGPDALNRMLSWTFASNMEALKYVNRDEVASSRFGPNPRAPVSGRLERIPYAEAYPMAVEFLGQLEKDYRFKSTETASRELAGIVHVVGPDAVLEMFQPMKLDPKTGELVKDLEKMHIVQGLLAKSGWRTDEAVPAPAPGKLHPAYYAGAKP